MKKIIALFLALIMMLVTLQPVDKQQAEASTIYITVSDFAQALVEQMGLGKLDGNEESGYVNQLINIGVIKKGDFKSYSSALKRGDMVVLLSRADDYLNKTSVDSDLVQVVIDKRISDISKVSSSKKEDVAKGYIKGFLKGYSNGNYSSNRELKVNNKIVKKDALNCIKMLTDKSLRAKISPDGQLIRTTNLPNNAYMFPYILASYPNRYYEARLMFEGVTKRHNGILVDMKSPDDYTYPVDVAKANDLTNFEDSREKCLDLWMDKVYTRVWNTFNVNYKTIDNKWVDTIAKTDNFIIYSSKILYEYLNQYVSEMKANKTIVECDKVSMDGSSMYYYNGEYYIRCYVHYHIVSTNTKTSYSADELDGKVWGPYNCVLFSRTSFVDLENYKLNKWVDGIFDISITTPVTGNSGSMFGVSICDWSPYLFRSIER